MLFNWFPTTCVFEMVTSLQVTNLRFNFQLKFIQAKIQGCQYPRAEELIERKIKLRRVLGLSLDVLTSKK